MKRNQVLLYVAAALCFFTAIGHTIGHFTIPDQNGEAVRSAYAMMEATVYPMPAGQSQNLLAFRHGSNLSLTVFLLLMGALFTLVARKPALDSFIRQVLLLVSLSAAAVSVLSALFFFIVPTVSLGVAAAIGFFITATSRSSRV